jgi:hypothetical protein
VTTGKVILICVVALTGVDIALALFGPEEGRGAFAISALFLAVGLALRVHIRDPK